MDKCPICLTKCINKKYDYGMVLKVNCPKCDFIFKIIDYKLSKSLFDKLTKKERAILRYWMQKQKSRSRIIDIDSTLLQSILNDIKLPKPKEQADNLIIFLGNKIDTPEKRLPLNLDNLSSIIGAIDNSGVKYVLDHLEKDGLIINEIFSNDEFDLKLGLTFLGWDRFETLKTKGYPVRKAFMAMQYEDLKLDAIYKEIKKAVNQTGFELFRIDDVLKAGLIDNQLRTEIRNSRFLLAELTKNNSGAYWEAGFAEGLGRPVIYLCEKKKFKKFKTHFDTNHHTTIIWDEENLSDAINQLKATIRATLPSEAKLTDD